MAGNDRERDQEEQPRVVISDKRHSRNEDEAPAEAQEQETHAEPELKVVEPEAEAKTGAGPDESSKPEPPKSREPERRGPGAEAPVEDMPQSAEMDQLKLIFEAGISSYLAGQVSMIINFALIYLGRAANPATGLVATDTKKAKIAIDTLEFVSAQIKDELPEAEQKQLAGIVGDLKYTFMQVATGGPAPTPPAGNGG